MVQLFDVIRNIFELGFISSLVVVAVHLSSNVIKFDDLSTEGSFALGGAIAATLFKLGFSSWLVMPLVMVCGGLVGVTTGFLHTKLKLNNLISGIVVTTALFSINLKIAGANVTLSQESTIFDCMNVQFLQPMGHVVILGIISLGIMAIVAWLLKTEVGFLLKAVGGNPLLLTALGKRVSLFKIIGLSIANSLTALAGALFILHIGFFSITGSVGILAVALAGLIIGQIICKNPFIGAILGAIGYQAIIAGTIEMQCDPGWNKLITAVLIIFLIAARKRIDTER